MLLRNHGLVDRDTVKICGYNSRLDTFQAVVGNWLLPSAKKIANQRIKNANFYDQEFSKLTEITIPPRVKGKIFLLNISSFIFEIFFNALFIFLSILNGFNVLIPIFL